MNENDQESSITSDFSSSVGIYRTPSNGFEEYQKRRETFLARIGTQPQDVDTFDYFCKRDVTDSDRKNYRAYEERKLANEERDR